MANFAVDPHLHLPLGFTLEDHAMHMPLFPHEVFITECYTLSNKEL
jgi:hypothetical protein